MLKLFFWLLNQRYNNLLWMFVLSYSVCRKVVRDEIQNFPVLIREKNKQNSTNL